MRKMPKGRRKTLLTTATTRQPDNPQQPDLPDERASDGRPTS